MTTTCRFIEHKEEIITISLPVLSGKSLEMRYITTKDKLKGSVTVEEPKSDEAVKDDDSECLYLEGYENGSITFFCSDCDYVTYQDIREWNYCPNCGRIIEGVGVY